MTLNEAIQHFDENCHNQESFEAKKQWLWGLDSLVKTLLLGQTDPLPSYGQDSLLMVPAPFDEVYFYYLQSKIHYQNADFTRFNNANAMFFTAWQRYGAHLLRQKGKQVNNQFF